MPGEEEKQMQNRRQIGAMVGNHAVAYAVKQAKPTVLSVYPITPQTTMLEKLADYVSTGELNARLIKVESEHSVLATIYGASLAGARVFTATASQGLLYMAEMVYWAGGARVPIVGAIATRAIGPPWSIWTDNQDIMAMRDTAWLQAMAENVQEAYDLTLLAFRISEDKRVLMPMMLGFDGFVLTHTMERLETLDDATVDAFLPKRDYALIDFEDPKGIGAVAGPKTYMDYKYKAKQAMDSAKLSIKEIMAEYNEIAGTNYNTTECYKCEDAEYLLVAMGAWSGDAKAAVDELRQQGKKAGLLKITVFRPFPNEDVLKQAKGKEVIVLDRAYSYGSSGVLALEVKSALYGTQTKVHSVIAGLGGRDVTPQQIEKLVEDCASGTLEDERWLL